MKKTFTIIAAIFMTALMAKAETQTTEMGSGNTDQAILEEHNTLVSAPAEPVEKDVKYWANTLASRLKVTGYAQAGYTATMPKNGENTNTFDMKRAILMVGAEIMREVAFKVLTNPAFEESTSKETMAPMVVYVAGKDDTLWSIAKKFKTSADSVSKLNELEDEGIVQGRKLLIIR